MTPRMALLGCLSLLAGCTVGPAYRKPAILTGAAPPPSLVSSSESAFDTIGPLPPRWWQLYDDPVLNQLVEKALVHNADLRQALATLEQVQGALQAAETKLTPDTSLSGNGSLGRISINNVQSISVPTLRTYSLTETVTYDLDLFGELRAAVNEEKDNVDAVNAALDLARVNIAAQVATTYAKACAAAEQIDLGERSVRLAQTMLDVTRRQFEAGIADATSLESSEEQLHETAASVPSEITQHRSALFTLATLTGEMPENIPAEVLSCTVPRILRRPIPTGDAASLLARRPDIRAAERKLAGSVADIDESTAELFPSFSIGALGGRIRTSLNGQSATSINLFSAGGAVSWSVPNLSATRAKIAESNASARSALAMFDGAVQSALKDTETALTTLARDLDAEHERADARHSAAVYKYAVEKKYAVGVGKIKDVLSAQQSLLQAETSLASARSEVAQDQVSLFKALGGGWQDAPAVAETPLSPVIDPTRRPER